MNILIVAKNFLPVIQNISLIFGIIFALIQFNKQTIIAQVNSDRLMKQSTVEFYYSFAKNSRDLYDKIDKTKTSYEDIQTNKGQKRIVTDYLAELQHLSVGVVIGVYDFETLALLSGKSLVIGYDLLQPYIDGVQKNKETPTRYQEFVDLAKAINSYRVESKHIITVKKKNIIKQY